MTSYDSQCVLVCPRVCLVLRGMSVCCVLCLLMPACLCIWASVSLNINACVYAWVCLCTHGSLHGVCVCVSVCVCVCCVQEMGGGHTMRLRV